MRKHAILVFGVSALMLAVVVSTIHAAETDIVISEVMSNSFCEGSNDSNYCNETSTSEIRFEWVEIHNKGNSSEALTNWQICDAADCDTFSVTVDSKEYVIVGFDTTVGTQSNTTLEDEINTYGIYDGSKTVALSNSIGNNGLKNADDAVIIKNASGTVIDCVSWVSGSTPSNTCNSLSVGTDTLLDSAADGQSISKVGTTWNFSKKVASQTYGGSPYGANTHIDDATIITLLAFGTRNRQNRASAAVPRQTIALLLGASLMLAASGLAALRHRRP